MRLLPINLKSNFQNHGTFRKGISDFIKILFFIALSLSITFSNYAQEDDSDFLEKVLEDKPKKSDPKKATPQNQTQPTNTKDKKKKLTKVTKKNSKPTAKLDPNKKTKPAGTEPNKPNTTQNIGNNKLNLEYWIHEELLMNPQNIPGFEEPKLADNTNPTNPITVNNPYKPVEKKPVEKVLEKESKPNAFFTFLNEYKKIIFIFAAIIIFAIYRLRYAGARNYNNSGRIFSKFRNK